MKKLPKVSSSLSRSLVLGDLKQKKKNFQIKKELHFLIQIFSKIQKNFFFFVSSWKNSNEIFFCTISCRFFLAIIQTKIIC